MIPFHIATPQGCDIRTFYSDSTWAKPPGVSHVYMMLLGGGGDGTGTEGGGSGAVTVWYGAAQHVPDSLVASVSTGNASNTTVNYRSASGLIALLTATGGVLNAAGTAMGANQFTASGFFKSTNGQAGSAAAQTAGSTFLSGGADNSTDSVTANYGYFVPGNGNGFFQMQPIIVGAGSSGNKDAAIGCGGGGFNGVGGPGLVLIASW